MSPQPRSQPGPEQDLHRVRDNLRDARDHISRLIERLEAGAAISSSSIEVAGAYLTAAERSLYDLPAAVDNTLLDAAELLEALARHSAPPDSQQERDLRERALLVADVIRLHLIGE